MSPTNFGASRAYWKSLFEAALVESEQDILPKRIEEARAAIASRLKELTAQPCNETMKLLDALDILDDLVRIMQSRNAA